MEETVPGVEGLPVLVGARGRVVLALGLGLEAVGVGGVDGATGELQGSRLGMCRKGRFELDQVVISSRPIAGVCRGQHIPAIAHLLVAQVPPPAPAQSCGGRSGAAGDRGQRACAEPGWVRESGREPRRDCLR